MPADIDDTASAVREFDASHWAPADHEYGILNLLLCRSAMPGDSAKPPEVENLKFVDSRTISWPEVPVTRRAGPVVEEDDDGVSEGEPWEATEFAPWPGKPGSWWRVNGSLVEDVLVRDGVSLSSVELRRVSPGDLVQQAGRARVLVEGRATGCVRLPIRPSGWVTADAQAAGGPKYLVRAGVPRWRVVYNPNVVVRAEADLTSPEVTSLHFGDVVEQAGPSAKRDNGIVRMPITTNIVRRSDAGDGDDQDGHHHHHHPNAKTLGWVTLDASEAGGPVFFKAAPDADAAKRRRRPNRGS